MENKQVCYECEQEIRESLWLHKQDHSGDVSIVTDEIIDAYGCSRHI